MPSRTSSSFARTSLIALVLAAAAFATAYAAPPATATAHAAPAAPVHRASPPARPAGETGATARLAARFAQPERLIRYHYLLQIRGLTEANLEQQYEAKVVAPLRGICETEAPKEAKDNAYVDTPDGALAKAGLSVRLREGRVTVQSWAPGVATLRDLDSCAVKRYELDSGGKPLFSEAVEIPYEPSDCKITPATTTLTALLKCLGGKCPAMASRLATLFTATPGARVLPVAHVYTADAEPQHQDNYLLRRGAIELWFDPATKQYFVELSFAAALQDRAKADAMNADIGAKLRAAGLVGSDPRTKLERYLALVAPPPAKH